MGKKHYLPAVVINHSRHSVLISCDGLNETLEAYYNSGVQQVDVVVELNRKQYAMTCTIYKKINRRTGRVYYWLYPLGAGQLVLRRKYASYRGAAKRYAKTPMTILIYSITPRETEDSATSTSETTQ